MRDALSDEQMAERRSALRPHLEAVTLPAICSIVLEYADDVHRVFFDKLFLPRPHTGSLKSDTLTCSQFVRRQSRPGCELCRPGRTFRICQTCDPDDANSVYEQWAVQFDRRAAKLRCAAGCNSATAPVTRAECKASVWLPTTSEAWAFICGGTLPALRQVITMCPLRAQSAAPGEIMTYVRENMRRKLARWCSMHECAAIARVRFGLD